MRICDVVERDRSIQIKFFLFCNIVKTTYLRKIVCDPPCNWFIRTGGADNSHFRSTIYAAAVWSVVRTIDHNKCGIHLYLDRGVSRNYYRHRFTSIHTKSRFVHSISVFFEKLCVFAFISRTVLRVYMLLLQVFADSVWRVLPN